MNNPWIPSYLRPYEEVIGAYLHDLDRFHSSKYLAATTAIVANETGERLLQTCVASFVVLAAGRSVIAKMADGKAKERILPEIDSSTTRLIDDLCVLVQGIDTANLEAKMAAIVSAIGLSAQSFDDAEIRKELFKVSSRLAEQCFDPQPRPIRTTDRPFKTLSGEPVSLRCSAS